MYPNSPKRYIRCSTGIVFPDEAYNSTVLIGSLMERAFWPCGTATVLRASGAVLCVTAAHVIEANQKKGGTLCIAHGDSHLIPIGARLKLTGGISPIIAYEPLDVAVICLSKYEAGLLSCNPLLDFPTHSAEDTYDGFYCLLGYTTSNFTGPLNLTEKYPSNPLHIVARSYVGPTPGLKGYHRTLHCLFSCTAPDNLPSPLNNHSRLSRSHRKIFLNFPRGMAGMSGCTIWKLNPKEACKPTGIVALQTGLYPGHGIIKATKWTAILRLIDQTVNKFSTS